MKQIKVIGVALVLMSSIVSSPVWAHGGGGGHGGGGFGGSWRWIWRWTLRRWLGDMVVADIMA